MDDLARYDLDPDSLVLARQALGLTIEQLADKLGVTRQSVWTWEAGRAPIDRRTALAIAFLGRMDGDRLVRRASITYDDKQARP